MAYDESSAPSIYDVVCGRGKKYSKHEGNKRLDALIVDNISKYSATSSKAEKSLIIADIISEIRSKSPYGRFVKQDSVTGKWHDVGDFVAREKISQSFRNILKDEYKSSSHCKKRHRQARKNEMDRKSEYLQLIQSGLLHSMQTFGNKPGVVREHVQLNPFKSHTPMRINVPINPLGLVSNRYCYPLMMRDRLSFNPSLLAKSVYSIPKRRSAASVCDTGEFDGWINNSQRQLATAYSIQNISTVMPENSLVDALRLIDFKKQTTLAL